MSDERGARVPIRPAWLAGVGLLLRVAAAFAVEWLARRRGTRCLFPDADVYWELATALLRGGPYVVSQWGVPHYALRTPGYPLFLAACRAAFGGATLPARLAQAVLGAACVLIVARLVERIIPGPTSRRGWTPALVAAGLVAVDPWTAGTSVLLLSEAVFLPLMLLGLWGMAGAWDAESRRGRYVALGAGVAFGAAVLVKPSWALFPPVAGVAWIAATRRRAAVVGVVLMGLGLGLVMAPWWVRNGRVYGRFVPTALWAGASLYDGLNPRATGASDMRFLEAPEVRGLDEEAQDAVLLRRSMAFVRAEPGRAARLAVIKAGRFWSPWPNAENVRSPVVTLLAAGVTLPVYGLVALGLWERRRDVRGLVLLAGPLLYFAAVHMVFVGSARYRIPGMVPALGLAGVPVCGWGLAVGRQPGVPPTPGAEG